MAASEDGLSTCFRLHLPVVMELSDGREIDSQGLKDIQQYLSSDCIILLNKDKHNVNRLKVVCITNISVENAQLVLEFDVKNREEFEEFVILSQSGELSRTFTQYAEENSLQVIAGYGLSTKLRCWIEMDAKTKEAGKAFFDYKPEPAVTTYSILALKSTEIVPHDKSGCQVLLKQLGLTDWALGNTKVFLKNYHIEMLLRQLEDFQRKVTKIQAVFRMILTRNKYYKLKWRKEKAVVQMQRYVRGWLVRKTYKTIFWRRKSSAIQIQKVYRGHIARKEVIPQISQLREAALKIQSRVRGHHVRKDVSRKSSNENQSAIMIKKVYRGNIARIEVLPQIRQLQEAGLKIQSSVICQLVRKDVSLKRSKENQSAIMIQKVYRGHMARKEVIPQIRQRREAALKIQSSVRGHLVRKDVSSKQSNENKSAILIQKVYRGHIARKEVIPQIRQRRDAALKIQSRVRGHLVRKDVSRKRSKENQSATMIQKVYRGHIARKEVIPQIRQRREAALKIQSRVRGHLVRKDVSRKRSNENQSAIMIQKVFRSHRARTLAQKLMSEQKMEELKAAIIIQSYYRMWHCKSIYQQMLKLKAQKELQMIDFAQQVEAYSKDIHSTLLNKNFLVNPHYDSKQNSPKKKASAPPHIEPEAVYAVPDKSRKREAPAIPRGPPKKERVEIKPVPDVGEERLELVEAYSKDIHSTLLNKNFLVNPHYDSKQNSPKKKASAPPHIEPEAVYAIPDKSRKREAPAIPRGPPKKERVEIKPVPDVGEERLELVEASSKDIHSTLLNKNFLVNPHYNSKQNSPKKTASAPPHIEPEAVYAIPDKSRKQEVPAIPRGPPKKERVEIKPVPDVGEERLEHMKKMNELKKFMPDAEYDYESRLVEASSKDIHSTLLNKNFLVNPHYDSKQNSPKKTASAPPHIEPEAVYAIPDKSRKQEVPAIPRGPPKKERVEIKPVPDVGEERLEHMKKMNELKKFMPDAEYDYESRLNPKIHTEEVRVRIDYQGPGPSTSKIKLNTATEVKKTRTRTKDAQQRGYMDMSPTNSLPSNTRGKSSSDTPVMRKEILLQLCKRKNETYERVSIEVRDWNIKNEVHSQNMIAVDDNLWKAEVLLPLTSLVENVDYSFKVDKHSYTYWGFKKSSNTIESDVYQMQEEDTIRQFFDKQRPLRSEVVVHLKDIVTRHSKEKTLADCTMQIEKFCKRNHFSIEDHKYLYRNLLYAIDKESKTQLLLCAVVFGNLFKSDYTVADNFLSSEMAHKVCSSFTSFKSIELSSSCSNYLFDVADNFCRVALGRHYSFLSCISIVYPFFDETFISSKVNEVVRRKKCLVAESVQDVTEKHILTLFEKVCQRAEMEQARKLLEQLILHIPLSQALTIYIDLKKKDSDLFISADGENMLRDTLLEKARTFLRSTKRNMKELESFVLSIDRIPELAAAKAELETSISRNVGTAMQNEKDSLTELILREDLFVTEKSQLHLIKSFTSLKLPYLHFILFDILMEKKFSEALPKADTVWFHDCFYNAVLHIKREENEDKRLEYVYKYLAKAQGIFVHLGSEELISYLNKTGLEYLKAIDLRKLMKMTQVIEDLSEKDSSIGDMFNRHVQAILRDQYESNYHEMLLSLCGTYGKLRINSSVTASIVTTIIDMCMPKTNDLLEEFRELVLQSSLWVTIFQAYGKEVNRVRETSNYQRIIHIVKGMVNKLREHEVPHGYLENITVKATKDDVTSLLTLEEKVTITEINLCWNQIQNIYEVELEKIFSSCKVLWHIQKKLVIDTVPSNAKVIVNKLNAMKLNIETGKVMASQLKNKNLFWSDLQELPGKCVFLKEYVKSAIFWKSCSEIVKNAFDEQLKVLTEKESEKEAFESVPRSFGNSVSVETDQECAISEILLLLGILTDKGIAEYKQAWISLWRDQDRDVEYALTLLSGVDVDEEVCFAENNLGLPVPENVKKTLQRLERIHSYERLVEGVSQSLDVFGIERESSIDIHDAITSFESLKENNFTCPFSTVVKSLEKIDSFAKDWRAETVEILSVLSNSSSLIEFLREIVEEDIRNLIDAVEDISEQHVQESTVSALIDVKSFLHGLLIKTPKDITAQYFLDLINKQTKTKTATKIPAKIDECMNSLHNLKSLYGNVANRGEMTTEIIGNIISRGKFRFEIGEDGTCDFHVTYKHGSVKEKHAKHSLIDLRSRALLLMNTRTKVHDRKHHRNDLERFVSYVDLSIDITYLLSDLHQSGNMSFITYGVSKDCQALADLHEQLHSRKTEWDQVLDSSRDEFYLLNFIHGPEIHLLYNCFEKNIGTEKVITLLRFIHPDLKLDYLLELYKSLKPDERRDEDLLRCFGMVLHTGYEGKKPLQRALNFPKSQSKRLTEVVQNRHLFVAALDENSNQVIKSLLSLYINTTQTLPEPHQVLFCTKDTTWNELELLFYRCMGSFKFTRVRQLFCIANVELLPNELQFKLVETLRKVETNENFLLSLICRGSGKHPFLDELSSATNKTLAMLSDEQLRQAFQAECPDVVTYTSTVPGLGKTSKIKEKAFASQKAVMKLHLSGPLHKKTLIERLSAYNLQDYHALYIDIGTVDNVVELDTFIFELIILRHVIASFKSFSLVTGCVYIEVANTINDTLRNSLNTVMGFKREHLKWENYDDFLVSMENNSPVQVVCQYLDYLDKGILDSKDLQFGSHSSVGSLPPSHCRKLLRKHFGGVDNLSFTGVNIFLNVLADQLKKMSCSSFFRVSRILEMTGDKSLPVVRSTLANALIEASKEFSSRSIESCRSTQLSTVGASDSSEEATSLSCRSNFAEMVKQRVEGMIRWEDSNHLIFVFHSQNMQTISPMYRDIGMVPRHIQSLFESQMKRKMQDFGVMTQGELLTLLQKVARANPRPLSDSTVKELHAVYALTPDNLLKMVLIMLRVRSTIPVLVMGETGCGKTSLIRYLATVSDVEFEVLSIHAGVGEDKIIQTINESNERAFLDHDKERWLFLDEINTSEHIGLMTDAICSRTCLGKALAPNLVVMGACNPYKLRTEAAISTAGLKGKVQTDELSKLVYRVLPLPERLVDFVWDFGTLSDSDEAVYIGRMIDDIFPGETSILKLLQDLLSASQVFVRNQESVSYCVSLRDIQRCKALIRWFLDILPKQHSIRVLDQKTDAIVLALAICYHSRFSSNKQRLMYRKELQTVFMKHGRRDWNEEAINRKIIEEQKDILRRMDLPPGTAKNTALQENVFVILVCLLNKIPIFLVGKPGCSKSLSMQVIRSNLRGKDSKHAFFKRLPQLYCVSFQGSESSTSDGIIKVFEKATRYQETNNAEEVLSVVILDEIGLAEISRFNPLKVLHSLLEPDGRPQPDVAVVGISNWALDASKMNRAIHLSRPDMDEEELYQTGVSISESFIESKQSVTHSRISTHQMPALTDKATYVLKDIAASYLKYVDKLTFKNFHGLRDYYSLVKFISRGFLEEGVAEKDAIVFEGLQRNFGGLPAESATLLNMFQIQANSTDLEATNVMKLMKENIDDQLARHLMCITSGDSALGLVERLLAEMNRDEKVMIFGSQFEEDQTADYNYRILSRIILCMEQGFVLILKDLENIYGSLYDMLNQNYTVIGKKKHCRVALGHYSNPICHVHDRFRCIVLVDESKVDYSDPPFLNRFEKQYLRFTDTVNKEEAGLIEELHCWTEQFSAVKGGNFDQNDCFPIYSQDMIPSLVIKTSRASSERDVQEEIFEICKRELLHIVQSDAVFRLENNKHTSMQRNAKRMKDDFLKLPIHFGIWQFIEYQLVSLRDDDPGLLTVVLTNSSMHSQDLYKHKSYDVQMEKLGAFKSEKQLYLRIQHFWTEASEPILFLHCSAAEDEKHISLAKATIDNIRAEVLRERPTVRKHVYLIIHMDRRRAETKVKLPINYLSGWEIVMLDSLAQPAIPLPELSTLTLVETVKKQKPLKRYIMEQLFWSFSRIRYGTHGRDLNSIQAVIEQIEGSEEFLCLIEQHVMDFVNNKFRGREDREWLKDIALNPFFINTSSSFLVALEQEVFSVVKEPIAKLIYQLENMNVITCFFCEDRCGDRKASLEKMLNDESFFTISSVHSESGPECYSCMAIDLPLCMPFSKLVFDKIEETKEEFMDTYYKVKEKCDLDEDDVMPSEVLEMLFSKHEGLVEQTLQNLSDYEYSTLCEDYYHDFCYFMSYSIPSKMTPERKYQVIRWSLEQEIKLQSSSPIELMVKLHATTWMSSSALSAEYVLFETCSEIFNMDENFLQFLGCSSDSFQGEPLADSSSGQAMDVSLPDCEAVSSEAFSTCSADETIEIDDDIQLEIIATQEPLGSDSYISLGENASSSKQFSQLSLHEEGDVASDSTGFDEIKTVRDSECDTNEDVTHFDQNLEATERTQGNYSRQDNDTVLEEGRTDHLFTEAIIEAEDLNRYEEHPMETDKQLSLHEEGDVASDSTGFDEIKTVRDSECDTNEDVTHFDQNLEATERTQGNYSRQDNDTVLEEGRTDHLFTEAIIEAEDLNRYEEHPMETDYIVKEESSIIDNQAAKLASAMEEMSMKHAEGASILFHEHNKPLTGDNILLETSITNVDATSSTMKIVRNSTESRKELVQFVCRNLLPSQSTINIIGTVDEWKKRVSVVLTHAVKITSDSMVLHSLRFCLDLVTVVTQDLPALKWVNVLTLGKILQTDEDSKLDSSECFHCVFGLIFDKPQLPCRDAKKVLSSYLNRCIAADADTDAVIKLLQLPLDHNFLDSNFVILKPPLQLALQLSVLDAEEDVFLCLIKDRSDNLKLGDFPFLQALDRTLKSHKSTICMDSQFAVLVADLIEELFNQNLDELLDGDVEEVKMLLLSVQNIITGCDYGLQFLSAISFYKSFVSYYAGVLKQNDFDTSKCLMYLQTIKAVLDKETDITISKGMKQYFVKEIGKGMLPWTLYKTSDKLTESFDFLKSWQWTENYIQQCIEGNPLLQCAPDQVKIMFDILDQNDFDLQQTMFRDYLNDSKECNGLLALYAASLSKFYITRRYKQQDDTYNQLADSLVKIAEVEKLDSKNLHFLACILGVQLFTWLELHERYDEIHTACAIFSSSLFAMLFVSNQKVDECCQLPLLARMLICPDRVEVAVMTSLRSFSKVEEEKFKDSDTICMTCKCGYRLVTCNKYRDDMCCPLCSHKLCIPMKSSDENRPCRKLSIAAEIVQRFIHLCVDACLLGSFVLHLSTEKTIEQVTGICEVDDIPNTLIESINKNFIDLQLILAMNCRDMYIFLQACLLHVKDFLTENKGPLSTDEHVHEWTDQLILKLEPLIRDRYTTIILAVQQQSTAIQKTCKGSELSANENDSASLMSDERKSLLPSLFRVQGKGDRTMFELELNMLANRATHPYPFLLYVLDTLPDLSLTKHLLSLVRWHVATVTQIEFRMKKRQCMEMTVEDFIHSDTNENMRRRLQKRFESLQEALSVLADDGQRFEGLSCRITSQTKMKDCLILDASSVLYTRMKQLCEIQNRFLDTALGISVKEDCGALKFLLKGDGFSGIPVSSIAEMKSSSIVQYIWDDELLNFSHADLRYGYGAQIRYEFETIEKILALKLVAGKTYIMLENCLPPVAFVDEFYKGYGTMVKEISCIIPQEALSFEIVHGIKEKREQQPRLTVELITHIGVLISLVKKTRGEADMPLIEYVETWKHVLTSPMPSKLVPSPENSLRLCHLIALYGFLEELNADSLVDSLGDEYRKSISIDIQNELNALLRSNQRLAEMILKAAKRFVYRCLCSGGIDSNQPLEEYLADASFWPCDISSYLEGLAGPAGDGNQNSHTDYLPKDLRVHHVFEMISHLGSKLKLQELSEKDVKLIQMATSFSSRGTRTTAEKKKKMARKRMA